MYPTIQIDTVAINTTAVLTLFSLWVGLARAEAIAQKNGFISTTVFNLCLIATAGGLIGARLGFVIHYLDAFLANLSSLISPNPLMLDLSGGILGIVLAGLIYIQRKKMPILKSLDAVVPCLLIFAIGLGLSHLASGYAFGAVTNLPWGLPLWGALRQPTQVFEILLASLWAFLLWPENPWVKVDFFQVDGVRFLAFFALTAFSRFLIEPLRGDASTFIGVFHLPQVLALGLMILSLALIWFRLQNQPIVTVSSEKE
jgi:phosphatidylglycerol---prolipoprotein diacylglyceryl transferase